MHAEKTTYPTRISLDILKPDSEVLVSMSVVGQLVDCVQDDVKGIVVSEALEESSKLGESEAEVWFLSENAVRT